MTLRTMPPGRLVLGHRQQVGHARHVGELGLAEHRRQRLAGLGVVGPAPRRHGETRPPRGPRTSAEPSLPNDGRRRRLGRGRRPAACRCRDPCRRRPPGDRRPQRPSRASRIGAASDDAPVWTAWIATASANTTRPPETTEPDPRPADGLARRRQEVSLEQQQDGRRADRERQPRVIAAEERQHPQGGGDAAAVGIAEQQTAQHGRGRAPATIATIIGRPAENGLTPETFTSSTTSATASRTG